MRRYETIVIAHPSLSPEERQPFFDKLTNLISGSQGLLIKVDDWGQKRLAYEIKKQTRGYYLLLEYCGDGTLVRELERNVRLDDRNLKYMTVCVAPTVDLEKVKAEIEAAEKEKASRAESVQTETPSEAGQQTQAQPQGLSEPEIVEATPEPAENEEATDGNDERDDEF